MNPVQRLRVSSFDIPFNSTIPTLSLPLPPPAGRDQHQDSQRLRLPLSSSLSGNSRSSFLAPSSSPTFQFLGLSGFSESHPRATSQASEGSSSRGALQQGQMAGRRWVAQAAAAATVALLLLLAASHGGGTETGVKNSQQVFNYTLAKAVVEYAAAGFEMSCIVVDVQNCLQAFVGVDHKLNAIIVAIRGTQVNSVQNWIKDMIWKQVNLNYPNLPNAKVHTGFYSSYNNTLLRPAIMNAVRKARKSYGDINIIVTGHSMGGAIASFCALDLAIALGSNNVHLMTFGQPRVGNAAFASYFAKYVPNTIRVTHEHDIVPHLPPYFFFLPQLTYRHFPREVWEHDVDGNTAFQVCDGSGEDPNCCRSVFVLFWSASDHLTYLGVDIEADEWSTCRIVLGRSFQQFQMELSSNSLMSKNSVDVIIADHSVQID